MAAPRMDERKRDELQRDADAEAGCRNKARLAPDATVRRTRILTSKVKQDKE